MFRKEDSRFHADRALWRSATGSPPNRPSELLRAIGYQPLQRYAHISTRISSVCEYEIWPASSDVLPGPPAESLTGAASNLTSPLCLRTNGVNEVIPSAGFSSTRPAPFPRRDAGRRAAPRSALRW